MRVPLSTVLLICLVLAQVAPASAGRTNVGYTVEVTEVTAQVGQKVMMHITLTPCDGCRILDAYDNRLSRLSSLDGKVDFDSPAVNPTVQGDKLVFTVGVTPTVPGRHPINGVFRVGYIDGPSTMNMVSVPLIAAVIGTH